MTFRGIGLKVFASRSLRCGALALALLLPSAASADIVVAPNANTSVAGNSMQLGILGRGNTTFQFAYDASQFSGIAVGSTLNGIGFRLPANVSTITSPLVYTSYSIEVATAAVPVGSLTSTFASNESADNTVVRLRALTIPAGSLVGGVGPNPFFELTFTTPFTYNGGSLVITVRDGNASDQSVVPFVDANAAGSVTGIGNTVANFGSSTATTGDGNGVDFYTVPIASFDFTPLAAVPEPAPVALVAASLLPALAYLKLRRRRAAA